VARTLADLTLKLTRELSAHEARCAKEVEQAEKSRDAALMKVGSLQSSLKRYHQGLSKAKDDQWKSVQKANEIRDTESHATVEARRQALLLQERKHTRDRAEALQGREDALRWNEERSGTSRCPRAPTFPTLRPAEGRRPCLRGSGSERPGVLPDVHREGSTGVSVGAPRSAGG